MATLAGFGLLTGCAASVPARAPSLGVVSALPLFWGKGVPMAIFGGEDQRAPVIRQLAAHHKLVPLDQVTTVQLGHITDLLVAQPRGLAPQELVEFDRWIRRGGRALIFADPILVWDSEFGLGDPRRAPPVTLLDPLLAHWGLTLESPDGNLPTQAEISLDGHNATGLGTGTFVTSNPYCRVSPDRRWVDCRIGRGRAVVVGDADILDLETAPDNIAAIEALLARLARSTSSNPKH